MSNPGSWAGVPRGLLGKFSGWNVTQRSVRSTPVIVLAPSFDLAPGVVRGRNHVAADAKLTKRVDLSTGVYPMVLGDVHRYIPAYITV